MWTKAFSSTTVFPNLFWFAALLSGIKDIDRHPWLVHRSLEQEIENIGGTTGTCLRHPSVPRYFGWESLLYNLDARIDNFKT